MLNELISLSVKEDIEIQVDPARLRPIGDYKYQTQVS